MRTEQRIKWIVAADLLSPWAPRAYAATLRADRAGDTYVITRNSETTTRTSDGLSSGSTEDRDVFVERIVAAHADGLEVEIDLPGDATAQERYIEWQFPARLFKPTSGPARLLNAAALQERADAWRKRAKLPPAACGRWYFTWNAFLVQCDPQSVLRVYDALDLRSTDLREGATYGDPQALSPTTLHRAPDGAQGSSFTATLTIDPAAVRRGRAETDLIVAEVSGKQLTMDQALSAHAADDVSGTISVRFDADATGRAQRRTIVTRRETRKPGGVVQTETATETVNYRLVRTVPAGRPAE